MNALYLIYFIFLYTAMIFTRVSMNAFQSDQFWNQLAQYNSMSHLEKRSYVMKTIHLLYWINADRFYWKDGDLNYLAEAFFAMAHIVSICRVCFLLPIIAFVGPLQVSKPTNRTTKFQIRLFSLGHARTSDDRYFQMDCFHLTILFGIWLLLIFSLCTL